MNMATLNILVEAAKMIEYDTDTYENRKKSSLFAGNDRNINAGSFGKPGLRFNQSDIDGMASVRRGTRETHNILEKNRRADMKNYFQKLKGNLPKLRDMVKASNVSILTDAVRHIQELTEVDKEYQKEMNRLRTCQIELEQRIKLLKEDIRRQHFCAQLFEEVQEEKRRIQGSSSPKIMMSVEVQANENDIKAELPLDTFSLRSNRNCLSDLRNDFSQNVLSSSERLSTLMGSKATPAKISFLGIENSPKPVQPLERLGLYSAEKVANEREISQNANEPKHKDRRKRKLIAENEDTDSDNDLKIILDEE